jgi:hypothetical protein
MGLHCNNRRLSVLIITGPHAGRTATLPRIDLTPKQGQYPFEWSRRQFPVSVTLNLYFLHLVIVSLTNAILYMVESNCAYLFATGASVLRDYHTQSPGAIS